MSTTLKSAAVAGVLLLATVGGAFAARLDHDTKVLDAPSKWADVLDWGYEGDFVKVVTCGPAYCLVKIDGLKGYVKKAAIDFSKGPKKPFPKPYPPYGPSPYGGPYGCITGPYGYVCI